MAKTVLILGGSGKIGQHSRRAFSEAGWTVRVYERSKNNLNAMAQGADVIVNGFNPPSYHNWAGIVPELTRQVIAAAKASGATVIVPGNVYNMGDSGGEWSEHTPHRPNTRKGKIREEMELAYQASGVQTIVLRAGNFIDPDRNGDVMSLLYLRQIQSGYLMLPGDANAKQALCYLPDWARAAVGLAEKRHELGQFEDVPFAGHCFTAEELRVFMAQELGKKISMRAFPWIVFRLFSPFWETAREMLEMRYLWNTSHWLSNEKLSRLLPDFKPTPTDIVMRAGLPPDPGAVPRKLVSRAA